MQKLKTQKNQYQTDLRKLGGMNNRLENQIANVDREMNLLKQENFKMNQIQKTIRKIEKLTRERAEIEEKLQRQLQIAKDDWNQTSDRRRREIEEARKEYDAKIERGATRTKIPNFGRI
jgi:chromosome segregation ATPase